jgi:prolyl-tRNA editing enzyme YbaK/EbsC (Cys-tRNA(Pro) deacylase)
MNYNIQVKGGIIMSFEKVQAYFAQYGLADRCINLEKSSATVAEAAAALGTEEGRIAKTMSFLLDGKPLIVVVAGDARIDNHKFKQVFHKKPSMIPFEDCEKLIGHQPGGVCPFCLPEGTPVYLDVSLMRFNEVFPAAGTDHSAVRLSVDELVKYGHSRGWVDVCKHWTMK